MYDLITTQGNIFDIWMISEWGSARENCCCFVLTTTPRTRCHRMWWSNHVLEHFYRKNSLIYECKFKSKDLFFLNRKKK